MPTPKISVIVPVYNAEKSLCRCIDSILTQTYQDFELLLIDDGSKDSSGTICDSYAAKDSRIKVFHKPNGGVSSARNLGIDNAQGEWLTFVDADDWVYPLWLQSLMQFDGKYDLAVIGFEVSCSCEYVNNQKMHGVAYEGNIKEGLVSLFRSHCFGYLWVKRLRTSIIRENRLFFDENIHLQEDEDFLMKYAVYSSSMVSVDGCYYYYYYPCYEGKYKKELEDNGFYMAEALLKTSLNLYGSYDSELVLYYLNYYTDSIVDIYERKLDSRISFLKRYRKILGSGLLKSRLFVLTKWLVYLDCFCFFSSILLDFHTSYKSLGKNECCSCCICL